MTMQNQRKITIQQLQLGMYVSKLDRPWVETPFMFQGFNIRTKGEIEELGKYCEYVFVDDEKFFKNDRESTTLRFSSRQKPETSIANKPSAVVTKKIEITNDFKKVLPTDRSFKKTMKEALDIHKDTRMYVQNIMKNIKRGKDIDVGEAKTLVGNLAENIVQNPTALLWLTQLKDRDEFTSIHAMNVSILALYFGRSLGLSMEQLQDLGLGALLHDIGKLKTPLSILNKPGKLSGFEFDEIKKHTVYGYDLLKEKKEVNEEVLRIVRGHHERLDGRGYPDGLQDDQISYLTKIVSIVDVYDAVTSKRSYGEDDTPYNAINGIFKDRIGRFDSALVEEFVKHIGVYPIGCVVELTTGHVGIVTSIADKHHLSPMVLLVLDRAKKPYDQKKYLNLADDMWSESPSPPKISRVVEPQVYNLDIPSLILKESLNLTRG